VASITSKAIVIALVEGHRTNESTASFHIDSLDGIRGVAFLLVFFSHAGLRYIIPGGFGVTVFFVLSGYLITTLLRLEYDESGRIDLKAFYLRRTFRILPLFYVVMVAAVLLGWSGELSTGGYRQAVIYQALHWSNFYLITHPADAVVGGTIVLWSLAVEEHFYLIFPLLYGYTRRHLSNTAQARLLWGLCLVCLLWRCALIFGMHSNSVRTELGTDTRFDCLLFGAILAITANPALDAPRCFTRKHLKLLVPLSLACLLFTFLYRNEGFRYTLRFTLQAIALLPLFAYVILNRTSIAFRFLNSSIMVQIGVLSYALYLLHAVLLDWFSIHMHAGKVAVDAIALATALLLAKFLQISVERPFQSLRKQYSRLSRLKRESANYGDASN
jgi:peptidoglycan/LPS O-acetylase OafA/YrhL